jgi:transcriptional regulator NrdR family protein
LEAADTSQALRIRTVSGLQPFSRDTLLLSVYDSLRHRKTAVTDATALTTTIIGNLYGLVEDATVPRDAITEVTTAVLERFDPVAATHYRAFHP